MSSKIDICNMALSELGERHISTLDVESLTDPNSRKAVEQCNLFFDNDRDAVLIDYRWRFAIGRVALAQDSISPVSEEWDNQFILPEDCIRVLQMQWKDIAFAREGDRLLTNESTASIVYIKRSLEYGKWDALAIQALANVLAQDLAKPLLGAKDGAGVKNDLSQDLENIIIPRAIKTNAIQSNEVDFIRVNPGQWVRSRNMSRNPFPGLRMVNPA